MTPIDVLVASISDAPSMFEERMKICNTLWANDINVYLMTHSSVLLKFFYSANFNTN